MNYYIKILSTLCLVIIFFGFSMIGYTPFAKAERKSTEYYLTKVCDENIVNFLKETGYGLYEIQKVCKNSYYIIEEEGINRYEAVRKQLLLKGISKENVNKLFNKIQNQKKLKEKLGKHSITHSDKISTNYSFAGILWSDKIEDVKKKLEKSGFFRKIVLTEDVEGGVHLDDDLYNEHSNELISNYHEICNKCPKTFSTNHVLIANLKGKKHLTTTPIKNAKFYFNSVTGQLLYYQLVTRTENAQNIFSALQKKYKNFTQIKNYESWAKFETGDEVIFFQLSAQKYNHDIIYIKYGNIKNALDVCETAQREIQTEKGKFIESAF